MLCRAWVVAPHLFLLISSFAFANRTDNNKNLRNIRLQSGEEEEETVAQHALAGNIIERHRALSTGVVFYESQAAFDAAALGSTNLAGEDFSNSPVGPDESITCDVTTIDSTTTPNNCLGPVEPGFSISSSFPGASDFLVSGEGTTVDGTRYGTNGIGLFSFADSMDITFTGTTNFVAINLFVRDPFAFTVQLFDGSGNVFGSQVFNEMGSLSYSHAFVGIFSDTPIAKARILSPDNAEDILNLSFGIFTCGPSMEPVPEGHKCCDIGLIGPDCCGPFPFSPDESSCCDDAGTVVELGTCLTGQPSSFPSSSIQPSSIPSSPPSSHPSALPSSSPSSQPSAFPSSQPSSLPSSTPSVSPSSQPSSSPSLSPSTQPSSSPSLSPSTQPSSTPSSTPSSQPSDFPSSEPTRFTCNLGPVCDYEFNSDGSGGILELTETYYAVCEWHDDHYHQGCYPESLVKDVGPGQMIPGTDNRQIEDCGCCPEDGTKIKGNTPVCDGALDCYATSTVVSSASFRRLKEKKAKKSKKSKKAKFETCIDGDFFMEENFYVPRGGETVSCGDCTDRVVVI